MAAVGDARERIGQGRAFEQRFGLLVVGDIVQQADEQRLADMHGRERQVHGAQGAVALAHHDFARPHAGGAARIVQRAVEIAQAFAGDRRIEQVGDAVAGQFVGRVAQVAGAGRVGVLDAAARFDHHQAFGHAVDNGAQALRLFLVAAAVAVDLQLGAHAGAHLGHAQRLADVVDRALVEAGHDVVGLVAGAHENDGDAGRAGVQLEPAAGFQAIHAGHDHIHQDQVGVDPARDAQGAFARRGQESLVALLRHHLAQHAKVGGGVIDNQNGSFTCSGDGVVHAFSSLAAGVGPHPS